MSDAWRESTQLAAICALSPVPHERPRLLRKRQMAPLAVAEFPTLSLQKTICDRFLTTPR